MAGRVWGERLHTWVGRGAVGMGARYRRSGRAPRLAPHRAPHQLRRGVVVVDLRGADQIVAGVGVDLVTCELRDVGGRVEKVCAMVARREVSREVSEGEVPTGGVFAGSGECHAAAAEYTPSAGTSPRPLASGTI